VRKPVVFDGAPDGRRYRGQLIVGQVKRRQGPGYNRLTFVQQEKVNGIIALQPNSCYGTESEQDRQTNPSTDIGWRVLQPEIHRQLPRTVEVRIA
jgi:hypothetical protein